MHVLPHQQQHFNAINAGYANLLIKPRKQWTHVLAADGASFTSPGIARWYMKQHGIKGTITFVR